MKVETVRAAVRRLAIQVACLLAALAVPAMAIAWYLAGRAAALSALIGVGFVALLFGASTLALGWAAGRSAGSALGILVGGSMARLVVYAAALSGLARLAWVDRVSLALATGGAVAITLAFELRALSRSPRLFWIDAEASHVSDVPHATRSQQL